MQNDLEKLLKQCDIAVSAGWVKTEIPFSSWKSVMIFMKTEIQLFFSAQNIEMTRATFKMKTC